MLAHGASLAERRVFPSSNERVIYQVHPEQVNVENKGIIPSSNEKVVNQARSERVNVGIRVLYSVLERV